MFFKYGNLKHLLEYIGAIKFCDGMISVVKMAEHKNVLVALNLKLLFFSGVVATPSIRNSFWKLRLYRLYPVFMSVLYSMVLQSYLLKSENIYKFRGHSSIT